MKVGDVAQHKETGQYGTVEYSTFGVSVHYYIDGFRHSTRTLGAPIKEIEKSWSVVPMPVGYGRGAFGGIRRLQEKKM